MSTGYILIVMATGSILFDGSTQYLVVSASSDFAPGLNDYTVEWWQLQNGHGGSTHPTIFSINSGSFINVTTASNFTSLAVTMELGTLILKENDLMVISSSVSGNWLDTWNHLAVTRKSGSAFAFQNGILFAIATSSNDINRTTDDLFIGSISGIQGGTYYRGNLTDFHFVNGTAKYTGSVIGERSFWPIVGMTPTANTKLLLNVPSSEDFLVDSSGLNKTVYSDSTGSYSTYYPTPDPTPTPTPEPTPTPTPTSTPSPTPTPLPIFAIQPILYRSTDFPMGRGVSVIDVLGRQVTTGSYEGCEAIEPFGLSFQPGDIVQLHATQNKYSFDYYEIWPPNTVDASSNSYMTQYGFIASYDPRTRIRLNETASLIGNRFGTRSGIVAKYR